MERWKIAHQKLPMTRRKRIVLRLLSLYFGWRRKKTPRKVNEMRKQRVRVQKEYCSGKYNVIRIRQKSRIKFNTLRCAVAERNAHKNVHCECCSTDTAKSAQWNANKTKHQPSTESEKNKINCNRNESNSRHSKSEKIGWLNVCAFFSYRRFFAKGKSGKKLCL